MCDWALPLLYDHIDISCHNERNLLQFEGHECVNMEEYHPMRRVAQWKELAVRQDMFLDTIIRNPIYGGMVSKLTWTYNRRWTFKSKLEQDSTLEYLDIDQDLMWEAWQLLIGFRKLDFYSFASNR